MEGDLVRDLLWISVTSNLSTALFLACRAVGGWAAGRCADQTAWTWKRRLVSLQAEKPWVLARFFVLSIQATLAIVGVIHLLIEGAVLEAPFIGLSSTGRGWFAFIIGCYMYQLVQDAWLQNHLPDYNVTFMHHLLAAVVYLVYLENRQNALYGTLGLLFLGAAPFFEMRGVLVELGVETHRAVYGASLVLHGLAAAVLRLLLPAGFMAYAFSVASPFRMDIMVLSSLFFSLVFFGMLSGWFVLSSAIALRGHRREKAAWECAKSPRTGLPHGLDIRPAKASRPGTCRLARYTARRLDLNRLAPCSNANLAPTKLTNIKEYHKMDISAFLSTIEAHKRAQDPPPEYTPALAALENVYTVQNEAGDGNPTAASATVDTEGALSLSSGEPTQQA